MQETLAGLRSSHKTLKKLIEDINVTGGLVSDPENPTLKVPNADKNWIDLAITTENAYLQCREIETILNAAGEPIPETEKCSDLIIF